MYILSQKHPWLNGLGCCSYHHQYYYHHHHHHTYNFSSYRLDGLPVTQLTVSQH